MKGNLVNMTYQNTISSMILLTFNVVLMDVGPLIETTVLNTSLSVHSTLRGQNLTMNLPSSKHKNQFSTLHKQYKRYYITIINFRAEKHAI